MHRIETDWKVPAVEKHIFVGESRVYTIIFHPDGYFECDLAGPASSEEDSAIFDWMHETMHKVRYLHDPSFREK